MPLKETSQIIHTGIAHGLGDLDLGHARLQKHAGNTIRALAVDFMLNRTSKRGQKTPFQGTA